MATITPMGYRVEAKYKPVSDAHEDRFAEAIISKLGKLKSHTYTEVDYDEVIAEFEDIEDAITARYRILTTMRQMGIEVVG